jgi:hypothetical protein
MTSSTLYREGDDLDTLLAELDGEFPGQVRVVEVSYPREGGVLGFFARQRVGVHFAIDGLAGPAPRPAPVRRPAPPPVGDDPLAELIASAEAADDRVATIDESTYLTESSNAEFAAMVLQLAAGKSRARPVAEAIVARPAVEPPAFEATLPAGFEPAFPTLAPTPAPPAIEPAPARPEILRTELARTEIARVEIAPAEIAPVEVTPAEPATTGGLAGRRRLAELGVPIDWVPSDAPDARAALTAVAARLPVPPRPPADSGQLLAIVGPAAAATRAAETVRNRLGLDPRFVWTAGDARPNPGGTPLPDETYATAFAACHRMGGYRPAIVVVPTDTVDGVTGADRMLAAMTPDSTWLVVDASSKPADARRRLRARDDVDALVVTGAADTASPATVWELDTPIALLDASFATPARWVSLLLDALADQER